MPRISMAALVGLWILMPFPTIAQDWQPFVDWEEFFAYLLYPDGSQEKRTDIDSA